MTAFLTILTFGRAPIGLLLRLLTLEIFTIIDLQGNLRLKSRMYLSICNSRNEFILLCLEQLLVFVFWIGTPILLL